MRTPDSIVNNRRHFWLAALATLAAIVFAHPTLAQPVKLKFSFFTSDRSTIYQAKIKPFVDAVNADAGGLVQIDVYFSGAISPDPALQAQLVADGTADLAIALPDFTPDVFPDTAVMELPGLFKNEREGSYVFTRLVEAGMLKGYPNFFVVGAFLSQGESIHSRKPIRTLEDLKGQTIRTSTRIHAETLQKLGAIPVQLPINHTTAALAEGKIDGATFPPVLLFEYGFGRVTSNHYMLRLGAVPTTILMNLQKFTSLSPAAQAVIRRHSGKWLSDLVSSDLDAKNNEVQARLESDPGRKVVRPSASDLAESQRAFDSVVNEWAASSRHNRELLDFVRAELVKFRSNE